MRDVIDTATANTCACANLRRTDLIVTQFYDGILAPGGISAFQFSLLCTVASFDSITINRLAKIIDMDRATLARDMKVLIDEEFVSYEEGRDQYTKRLLLTQKGKQVLERSWSLWQEAQRRIANHFGQSRFEALLSELQEVRTVLNSAVRDIPTF